MSTTIPARQLTVWFLTGSQELYGEETLRQVAEQSRRVADELGSAGPGEVGLGVDVLWKPVLTDAASVHRTILEANADPHCAGVVTWMHTFSPAKMWIAGLDALRKPLLHLHTQADASLPWASIDMDFMNLNQAAHGDRELGHVVGRLGLARAVVAGHVSNPVVGERVAAWACAARGAHELRTMRVARFGDNMRDVAVTEGDKVEAQIRFGVSVNTYGVTELVDLVDSAPVDTVDGLIEEYLDTYAVAAELRPGAERHDSLRYGAAVEWGLRTFLVEGGFTAFTTNFEDLGGLRQLPGLAVQRLMADGYGFGGEGDWKTSVLLRTIKAMGAGRPGGTSFMEDYTYDLTTPGQERILGAHMLEVCPSIASATPSLEIHPLAIGGREDPVRLRFTAAPAAAVVVGMSDLGDRFRLTLNEVEVVEPTEPLPRLPVACATWRPEPDFATSTESWILSGAPHHTVLSTAVGTPELRHLAEMLHTELVVIDRAASVEGVRDRLRWSAAYHRLTTQLSV